jgi:hypothetical protein
MHYRAFLTYRDLGLGVRSIPATAKVLGLSQRSGQVGAWSSRNRWRERVNAWDGELERQKQIALTEEIQKMVQRHVAVAQSYVTTLMEPAREMARRLKDPQFRDLEDLPTAQLLTLAARCASVIPNLMKAERLSRGEPIVVAEQNGPLRRNYEPELFQCIDRYAAAFERVLTCGEKAAAEARGRVAMS